MDPSSIAFAQLAEVYRRSGALDEAIETCRTGLARHPEYRSARVTLGRALLQRDQLDDAERELNEVLRAAPESLAALRGLAEIARRRGDVGQALVTSRRALALAQNDPDLQRMVADLTAPLRAATAQPAPVPSTPWSSTPWKSAVAAHAGRRETTAGGPGAVAGRD